ATYEVGFPLVRDVAFKRDASGSISKLVDPVDGSTVSIDASGTTVSWADISSKPPIIAAGASKQDARNDIGAGTSDFSGAYADLTGKPSIPTNNNQLTNGEGYVKTDTTYTAGANISIDGGNQISVQG